MIRSLLCLVTFTLMLSWSAAASQDPAALWQAIENTRLEPDKAVSSVLG